MLTEVRHHIRLRGMLFINRTHAVKRAFPDSRHGYWQRYRVRWLY